MNISTLLANDFPSNAIFSLMQNCGNTSGIGVTSNGTQIMIQGGNDPGVYTFCYSITGCNGQRCDVATVRIVVTNPALAEACENLEDCQINPFMDFEEFGSDEELHQLLTAGYNGFGFYGPPWYQDNTPDLVVLSEENGWPCDGNPQEVFSPSGNQFLRFVMRRYNNTNLGEGISLPLCEPIFPGMSGTVTFLATALNPCLIFGPNIRVEFSENAPVAGAVVYDDPGISSPSWFVPITSTPNTNPAFATYTVNFTNESNVCWNYLYLSSFTQNEMPPPPSPLLGTLYVDAVRVDINNNLLDLLDIATNVAPENPCLGDQVNVTVEVCNNVECDGNSFSNPATLITAQLPLGLTLIPNPDFPSLTRLINEGDIPPGACIELTLTLQVSSDEVLDGENLPINLQLNPLAPCFYGAMLNAGSVTPMTCNPEFVCPCVPGGTLNINATASSPYYNSALDGVLYSVLEQAENLDQNNDGEIYGAEHGGCIAIAGRLIIDQDINFNSANIVMQPCAEIVVQRVGSGALPTLRLETNQINGCEQMWRGITVEDGARLELLENAIADAEFAVTAKASFAGASDLTSVAIQDNLFRRNHVGVKFEGIPNQFSTVVHFPFINNTFLGYQAGASLLPPCNPKLENYFSQYGYAGVVALNTSLFLGTTLPKGEVSNDFNGLRNGVISKQARLDVRSNRFQNINQEYWGTINSNEFHQGGSASPTYEYSSGIAIAAERGTASIEGNQFNSCGHGVFSSFASYTAVRNNDFNPVGIAVEAFAPYDLLVRDNTNMVFARRAVVARELNASSRYLIEGNTGATGTIPGLADNPFWRFPAVQASNVGGLLLDDARISGNQFTTNNGAFYGFHLEGNGGWIIDENIVKGALIYEGVKMLQSDFNFLYNNTVERPLLQNNQGTAFSVSNGVNNRFCCNTANKVHKAFHFELYSDNTALFSNNLLEQNQSIFCPAGTIIGQQYDRGNDFGFITETATHLGPVSEIFNSRFKVQQLTKPFAPQNIFTPQAGSVPWFIFPGTNPSCDAACVPPDELPDLQGEDTDETDRALVNGDFHSDSPVLEWEGMRQLYSKLERKPDLRDDDAQVAAFYSSAKNGKLGAYYEAQRALYAQRQIGASQKAALAPLNAVLDSLNTQLNAAMIALQSAHGQDSLGILEAIRQNVTAQDMYAFNLAQLQNTIEQQRSQQTQTAIQLNNALPADAIYESNRKTVNEIYLQTLAQNIVTLTPTQLAQVSAIAHQCVFEGGAAVLDARLLYQLYETKAFVDDTLCSDSSQQRTSYLAQSVIQAVTLQPNPADKLVQIIGLGEGTLENIRIQLNSVHGQTRTIRLTQTFFSVADLPAGVYFCAIWNGDILLSTQRLLVIH